MNLGISPEQARIAQENRLISALERVANAFEEQNRYNLAWIELQKQWHEEDQENDTGKRIVAIHEENARREQAWREKQEASLEEQARKQEALVQAAHDAYIAHLKEILAADLEYMREHHQHE